jgi:hypothetical protein
MYAFRFRRGTASEWTEENPVLRSGEPGVEIDTNRLKIGDGVRTWNLLPYFVNEDVVRQLIDDLTNNVVVSHTRPVGYPDYTVWLEI